MTTCRTATQERQRRAVRRPMLTSLGLALGLALMAASEARAEHYRVYTSSAFPATLLNEADGVCTLAEAVASINQGSPAYNCFDYDQGSLTPVIELRQAANKPYSTHHFVIPSGFTNNPNAPNAGFEINRRVYIGTYEVGGTAYIDAATTQAFLIKSGVEVTLYGLEITHTGTGAGRAVKNFGSLYANTSTFKNGNVSGNNPGQGGAIYTSSYLSLDNCNVRNSLARQGGGIYNLDGRLDIVNSTISGNSATKAGGGIYNMSTANIQFGGPKGSIQATSSFITNNSAKAGGGVFNRGEINLTTCSVSSNIVSGTENGPESGETCHTPPGGSPISCNGNGGGILTLSFVGRGAAARMYSSATLSNNKASQRGGGIYNAGQMLFHSVLLNNNEARYGGAIYTTGIVDGESNYCEVTRAGDPPGQPQSSIVGNKTVPAGGYSIVDSSGGEGAVCLFDATASGNIGPWCEDGSVKEGYLCPQTAP